MRRSKGRGQKSSVPTNWPVVGMTPGILLNAHRLHEYMTEFLEQSACTFEFKGAWFTKMDMLITSDPSNVHYILSKHFSNFPKGPDFKKIFDVLGDGIFNAESESWETQRKTIMSLLNHHTFPKLVATTTLNKVERGMIPVLEHFSQLGTDVDLQELFERFTFDSTCLIVLGHDPASLTIDFPHAPYEKAFSDIEEAILYRHILPESYWKLQRWLQIGKEKKLSKAQETLDHFLDQCISLKRRQFRTKAPLNLVEDSTEGSDLLTAYMKAGEENIGVSANPPNILRDILLNLLVAGRDTISTALTWFFWLLATNPLEEKKIREEIITSMHTKEDRRWNFSNVGELKKLKYLHGALCESLRLFPPVALQHKAALKTDILPSGHCISTNKKTVLSFYSMGRTEKIWGKDCLVFKPGRWISDRGEIKHEPSFRFVAFNAGPRSCIGKEMSFIQMKIVAATMIYRYHIQLVEGHPISPSDSVILHMKHGLKVRVTKRCD
ncbi:unnamed protein product [Ilex paraguariensis]|uniref:Alkane hydroxylase MAH1-like n=1 Tax=Ilex paraguariensis TaxID=185542 RepID=A0ABC8TZP3_9AQUA